MSFDRWPGLLRKVLVGTLTYVSLLFLLRVSGKRMLSKFNAFDLVASVALGATLATELLSQDVAQTEGLVAFALLIGLQWIITWLSVRSQRVAQAVMTALAGSDASALRSDLGVSGRLSP